MLNVCKFVTYNATINISHQSMMALEGPEVTVTKWEPLKFLKEGQYQFISFTPVL